MKPDLTDIIVALCYLIFVSSLAAMMILGVLAEVGVLQ